MINLAKTAPSSTFTATAVDLLNRLALYASTTLKLNDAELLELLREFNERHALRLSTQLVAELAQAFSSANTPAAESIPIYARVAA